MLRLVLGVIALAVGAFIFALGVFLVYLPLHKGEATFIVQGKERIAEGNDGKWLVYAKDGETFQITDNWFKGKFDSTNRYRKLKVGRRYNCTTTGARWPLFSEYRNLLDCGEVLADYPRRTTPYLNRRATR